MPSRITRYVRRHQQSKLQERRAPREGTSPVVGRRRRPIQLVRAKPHCDLRFTGFRSIAVVSGCLLLSGLAVSKLSAQPGRRSDAAVSWAKVNVFELRLVPQLFGSSLPFDGRMRPAWLSSSPLMLRQGFSRPAEFGTRIGPGILPSVDGP